MKLRALASFAAVCAMTVAGAQHYVEYGMNLSLGFQYLEEYRQGAEGQGPLDFKLEEQGYGSVHGVANVGFGVNKAYVSLIGSEATNPLNFEYGFATSRYFDMVTISDPDLNGTIGTFTANLYVEGSGFFNVSQSIIESPDTLLEGFWHAVINVDSGVPNEYGGPIQSGYYAGDWVKDFGETELTYYGDPLNTYQQEVTFKFTYGEPIFLDTFLQTLISIDNQTGVPGTMEATIDLGNSAYWGGMKDFRDQFGNPVTGFDYYSSSGYNYLAVPEPATLAVLGLGLIALIRRRPRS